MRSLYLSPLISLPPSPPPPAGLRHPDDPGPAVVLPLADDPAGPGPQPGGGRGRLPLQGQERLGGGQRDLSGQGAR